MFFRSLMLLILTGCAATASSPSRNAESFTVRLFFEDLIGFALVADESGNTTQAWALVLDASDPSQLEFGTKAHSHTASLSVPSRFVTGNGWGCGEKAGAVNCRLRSSDIRIQTDSSQAFSVLTGVRDPDNEEPVEEGEHQDFSWVPEIERILDSPNFKPGLLEEDVQQNAHLLAARIKLDKGLLRNDQIHRVGSNHAFGKPVVFNITNSYRQALSKRSALEFEARGPVTLLKKDLGEPGSRAKELVIAAQPGEVVEITVKNTPDKKPSRGSGEALHFQLVYNLFDFSGLAPAHFPNPKTKGALKGILKVGDEACPPIQGGG